MRLAFTFAVCLGAVTCLAAQEAERRHSLFGCSENAVQVGVEKRPALGVVLLNQAPADAVEFQSAHHFVFHGASPFDDVKIYFSATLPESGVGRGSAATLGIYAETHSGPDGQTGQSQWWKIEPAGATHRGANDDSSASLKFDATRIGGCFEAQGECKFADVALATSDPDVAMVAIKFGENLGGANAENWTEASLLLDFRSSPPRVLATADCGYNEGGGACTAFDSGEMSRSELRCDWIGEERDFLCSEISSPAGQGHRDFFLLRDKAAPLRVSEMASLADAIQEFRRKGKTKPITVRGFGPVTWIDEVQTGPDGKVIVLSSHAFFYFVPETAGKFGTTVQVRPHAVLQEDKSADTGPFTSTDSDRWTLEEGPTAYSKRIYEGKGLIVLQVVAKALPDSQQLYWIGVSDQNEVDVVQLVGGSDYAGCGQFHGPAEVVAVGKIERPFAAEVRLQPATRSGEDSEDLAWDRSDDAPDAVECIRPGRIVWAEGKFRGTMKDSACGRAEKPKYVHVENDGRIMVTEKLIR